MMIKALQAIGSHRSVRITCDNIPIDAPWNFFNNVAEARTYANENMTFIKNRQYGVIDIKSEQWNLV